MPHLLSEAPGLVAFVRAVEAGSFSAAARDLGTTPSAVSKSVARLERHLGARLFRRSTRVLALTPEGQAFFDRVSPLLQEIEQSADIGAALGGPSRTAARQPAQRDRPAAAWTPS